MSRQTQSSLSKELNDLILQVLRDVAKNINKMDNKERIDFLKMTATLKKMIMAETTAAQGVFFSGKDDEEDEDDE